MVRLIDALRDKTDVDALRNQPIGPLLAEHLIHRVRHNVEPLLAHTTSLFPQYTNHDVRHSDGVVSILDWFVPDEVKSTLNAWEIYFLLASAYLHDIGMIENCPPFNETESWVKFHAGFLNGFQNKPSKDADPTFLAKQSYVRDSHHERSEQYLLTNYDKLGMNFTGTTAEAQIVGRISKGHRKVNLADKQQYGPVAFGNNQLIHRDLLAAYLRLADELDTTAMRTPTAEHESLRIDDPISQMEWAKHLSIGGISDHNGTILVSGNCSEHSVWLRLTALESSLREKLIETKRMLPIPYVYGQNRLLNSLPYHDVEMNIEHRGYIPAEISFRLDHDRIIHLLMGERLYGDETACVRELLQNAVDACRLAEQRSAALAKYSPQISVVESEGGETLTFYDNGIGMNLEDVREYFSNIGMSYYSSPQIEESFTPISEFGIGVLSCFMIADSIEIHTKRDGFDPIKFSVESINKPFVILPGTRTSRGTEIRLILKEKDRIWNIIDQVSKHARMVGIPISVTSGTGESQDIGGANYVPPSTQIMLETIKEEMEEDGWGREVKADLEALIQARECLSGSRRQQGIEMGVTLLPLASGFDITTRSGVGLLYQEGFYIRKLAHGEVDLPRQSFIELNISRDAGLKLAVDRTRTMQFPEELTLRANQMYLGIVEDLINSHHDQLQPAVWWATYHTYTNPFFEDVLELPSDHIESLSKNFLMCGADKHGYCSIDFEQLRTDPQLKLLPARNHSCVQFLLPFMPDGVTLGFIPTPQVASINGESPHIFYTLESFTSISGRSLRSISRPDFLELLGAKSWIESIDRQNVYLVDFGSPIGSPCINVPGEEHDSDRPDEERPYGDYFESLMLDARHPLIAEIFSTEKSALTWASKTALKELIENLNSCAKLMHTDTIWRPKNTIDAYIHKINELTEILTGLGILRTPYCLNISDFPPATHSCPYGDNQTVSLSYHDMWNLADAEARLVKE